MRSYKVLNKQVYASRDYAIVPIRTEDRYAIMQWRNEQIYHLRQPEPLTKEMQDAYFENVVDCLFDQEKPNQILFSYLHKDECIGYGGLVHINWVDRNAEISFVMNTELQEVNFISYWENYLTLVKRVAFLDLDLHKIYTYAFDLRPNLYKALEAGGFVQESRLKDHCFFEGKYYDVLYHGCINPKHHLELRTAVNKDADLLFTWVNDPEVRKSALNTEPILWESHLKWFKNKLNSEYCKIYIIENKLKKPVGQVRIELENNEWRIDYSIDKTFRGLGLGKEIIQKMLDENPGKSFRAEVKLTNKPSQKVFQKLGFKEVSKDEMSVFYTLSI